MFCKNQSLDIHLILDHFVIFLSALSYLDRYLLLEYCGPSTSTKIY